MVHSPDQWLCTIVGDEQCSREHAATDVHSRRARDRARDAYTASSYFVISREFITADHRVNSASAPLFTPVGDERCLGDTPPPTVQGCAHAIARIPYLNDMTSYDVLSEQWSPPPAVI